MNENKKILPCKICGNAPILSLCNMIFKGCTVQLWCVECDNNHYSNKKEFVEHKISVYGSNEEEAVSRWNNQLESSINNKDLVESLYNSIIFPPKDWSLTKHDAWMYGIIVGWDDNAIKELKQRFSWSDKEVQELKDLNKKFLSFK